MSWRRFQKRKRRSVGLVAISTKYMPSADDPNVSEPNLVVTCDLSGMTVSEPGLRNKTRVRRLLQHLNARCGCGCQYHRPDEADPVADLDRPERSG